MLITWLNLSLIVYLKENDLFGRICNAFCITFFYQFLNSYQKEKKKNVTGVVIFKQKKTPKWSHKYVDKPT